MNYSLHELADRFDCKIQGDSETTIQTVCTLQHGKPQAITFLANPKYRKYLGLTSAAAVILKEQDANQCPVAALINDNPYACYARIAHLLTAGKKPAGTIHPSAIIDGSATLGTGVEIGPYTVVGAGTVIGEHCRIGPGCTISEDVTIGAHSYLHSNISIYHGCQIGQRALIHAAVVIGSDGFGIAQDNGEWVKVPQLGRVIIGDDVELGASTTIDRGAIEDTVIEDGVKLDNQIQIGHNVHLGAHTAIAGCVGVAGSAEIGKRCTIAAMTLILGHIKLADDVHITAQSMVTKSISKAGVYSSGTPLQNNAQWKRNFIRFGQLDDLAKRVSRVEKNLTDH